VPFNKSDSSVGDSNGHNPAKMDSGDSVDDQQLAESNTSSCALSELGELSVEGDLSEYVQGRSCIVDLTSVADVDKAFVSKSFSALLTADCRHILLLVDTREVGSRCAWGVPFDISIPATIPL
jgi:hypothetical protein